MEVSWSWSHGAAQRPSSFMCPKTLLTCNLTSDCSTTYSQEDFNLCAALSSKLSTAKTPPGAPTPMPLKSASTSPATSRTWCSTKNTCTPVGPEKIGGIATSMLLTQRKPVLSLSKDRRV